MVVKAFTLLKREAPHRWPFVVVVLQEDPEPFVPDRFGLASELVLLLLPDNETKLVVVVI